MKIFQTIAENFSPVVLQTIFIVEGRQMEVFIAVSVGGVLTILTLSLIIVYVLVTRYLGQGHQFHYQAA